MHRHMPDNFLANEIPDLDLPESCLLILVHVDVDGKVRIDVAHLVLEAFRNAND